MTKPIDAFLLTRQWRDTANGITLDFCWATAFGPCWTTITAQDTVFFIARDQAEFASQVLTDLNHWRLTEVALKSWHNLPINALYCRSQRAARDALERLTEAGITCWEADIRPPERYLMERFVTAAAQIIPSRHPNQEKVIRDPVIRPGTFRPTLRMVSLDIETSMDAQTLYSIGVWSAEEQKVFMVGQGSTHPSIVYCDTAKQCLKQFFSWLQNVDPDVLIGWNIVQFDLWVLQNLSKKEGLMLAIGRDAKKVHWRKDDGESGRVYLSIPGRVALDGIDLLKAANHSFTSYALDNVAQVLLKKGKLLHGNQRGEDITQLFLNDKPTLATYNLRDCELVWDIFHQQNLLHFALERSQLTGLLLDRVGGSVAAFEFSYLPRLHRRGYIAPNLGELQSDVISPGGHVMESLPGIYHNVLVLDFKSLYPSIIRTFLIDPAGYWLAQHNKLSKKQTVEGFNGAYFARQGHILPNLIEHLSNARDQAKAQNNGPLSHAIKIIMNSFYGVLGSVGCRFFDPRVCSSITLRGHEIIQRSRTWIEQQGYQVIYGDTDSLFVWLEHNSDSTLKDNHACHFIGRQLAAGLNDWWRNMLREQFNLSSALEIQFETHYLRFLMPTIRGSDVGTKKRYAGVIVQDGESQLVFKGLENVRTDWTQLAKDFQLELYRRVFAGEDYLDFVRSTVQALIQGKNDNDLIYRKRLRRNLVEYQKNIPPHAQAARKLVDWTGVLLRRGDWVEYVITSSGPEPLRCQRAQLDYQHYIDKQLVPVADAILHFSQQSLAELIAPQIGLFD